MKKRFNSIDPFSGILLLSVFALFSINCHAPSGDIGNPIQETDRLQINTMLDQFNIAAANADYKTYFDFFTEDAVFIGTDATENWDKKSFMQWARPHFEKKKTWKFKSVDRHIFFDGTGNLAWFDELLNTQMKICRGSGVLIKQNGQWKVQQYVLSMTIPNSLSDSVIKIKAPVEEELLKRFTQP